MSRADGFWTAAAGAPLVVLTDFDFTISSVDVGELIARRLAPPSRETVDRFRRKEIGTRLYWLDSMNRVDAAQALALADSVSIDPHFADFAEWCRREGIPLAVVSDGFWYYIQHILTREGLGDLPVFSNEMPRRGVLEFPHGNPACDRCGCCKADVARRLHQDGSRVVYVGDGVSDLYAAGFADWVFAKEALARHMADHGSPYFELGGFDDVHRTLREHLEAFRSGTMERQARLGPHPFCRFESPR